MFSAKKVLDQLVVGGFIKSWTKRVYKEHGFRVTGFRVESDHLNITNETYGKQSFLYFYCKTPDIACNLVDFLRKSGVKPGTDWNGGTDRGCVELRVSYFKGHHHYE